MRGQRTRFWIEAALATVTGLLAVLTLVWREWIEAVFHVEPDGGSGTLEWLVVGALVAVTCAFAAAARADWRQRAAHV